MKRSSWLTVASKITSQLLRPPRFNKRRQRTRAVTVDMLECRMLLSATTTSTTFADIDTQAGAFATEIPPPTDAATGQIIDIVDQPVNGSAYIQYGTSGNSDSVVHVSSGSGGDLFSYLVEDSEGQQSLQNVQISDQGTTPTALNMSSSMSSGSGSGSSNSGSGFGSGSGAGSGSGSGSGTNSPPVANDDWGYTTHDHQTSDSVAWNDYDYDNDPLSFSVASGASHGTVAMSGDGSYTYTPNAGYVGSDSFDYTVSDGQESDTATVTIGVYNSVPEPSDDWGYGLHDHLMSDSVAWNDGLMSNGSAWQDYEADTISFVLVSSVTHGLLTLDGSTGEYTYQPNAGYVGSDVFTYQLSDGLATSTYTATVHIDVYNTVPEPSDDWAYTMHDQMMTDSVAWNDGLMSNGTAWQDYEADTVTFVLVDNVSHGTVTFDTGTGEFTYDPTPGFVGEDSFTYQLSDGIGSSQHIAVVTISVGNSSPTAEYDSGLDWTNPTTGVSQWINYFVLKGNTLSVPTDGGVLKNDSDPDVGDADSLKAILAPNGQYGTASLSSDGAFTYVPNEGVFEGNFYGLTDSFTYYAEDIHGARSSTVAVYIVLTMLKVTQVGPDLNDGNPAWVGDLLSYKAELVGGTGIPLDYIWGIPYDAYKTWVHNEQAAYLVNLGADDLDDSTVSFRMFQPAGFNVKATITAPLGQTDRKQVISSVERPDFGFTATTPSGPPTLQVLPGDTGPHYVGSFGQRSPITGQLISPGIVFQYSSNNRPLGEFVFVQTVDQSSTRYSVDGVPQRKMGSGLLDTFDPYPHVPGIPDTTADSPAIDFSDPAFAASYYSHSQSFQMYLMWKSPRAGSEPVPLATVSWSWGISATSSDGGSTWTMVPGSNTYTPNPAALFATQFPTWLGNVANLKWEADD